MTPDTPTTPDTPATPEVPTTPDATDDGARRVPQTGDSLRGVRLAVIPVAAMGIACVAAGLARAHRRMRR